MATPGEFLVNKTVTDVTELTQTLLECGANIDTIYQRYLAVTTAFPTALGDYTFPDGYTESDFTSLMTVLNALTQMCVTDSARNAMFKLISAIQ